jgi:mono/diheme cytochrome c family protein
MRHLVWVVLFVVGCAQTGVDVQPSSPPAATVAAPVARRLTHGEALYLRHCADCHGWEGRGDGPVAAALGVKAPSLRRPALFVDASEAELMARILYGRGLTLPLDTESAAMSEADVTAITAYVRRLPSIAWEQVNLGQEVYDSLCVYCHGLYGGGDGIMAQTLPTPPRDLGAPAFQSAVHDAELRRIISDGKGVMPGVGDLVNTEQLEAVVAYVRLMSPGYELYTRFCAVCHGPDGRPPEMDTDAIGEMNGMPEALPQVVFNEAYVRTRSERQLRRNVRHMLRQSQAIMPHFNGELSKDEVRHILHYLRTLP